MDKEKLKDLPDSPGVYLMKDKTGRVLYIGKASSLKKRVSSYFRKADLTPRTNLMVSKVDKVDFIPTHSEAEALIYEASMVKRLHPRYNVELRDDKSYPYIRLTNEEYPRLVMTRRRKSDASRYFGPYTNVKCLREALKYIRKIFKIRTCRKLPRRLCLLYHINECLGPCEKKISKREYRVMAGELALFLEGKRTRLLASLTKRMQASSKIMDYEQAGRIRDMIAALSVATQGGVKISAFDEVEDLRHLLHITRTLVRIEAFDISDISGKEAVGSLVVFINGKPKKDEYRKFRIKTVEGVNDYAMMKEVVSRRYRRALKERLSLPDLIIIDGGKGHLATARKALLELGLGKKPIIGIAKEFERVWLPGEDAPLALHKNSPILHLIQRIRDEAHRFAHAYHGVLRRKKLIG